VRKDYLDTVPAERLQPSARLVSDNKQRKLSFEPTDLAEILYNPFLVAKWTSIKPRDREVYWIVMMLTFSGARCREVVPRLTTTFDRRTASGI
jgi:hypothetical protein